MVVRHRGFRDPRARVGNGRAPRAAGEPLHPVRPRSPARRRREGDCSLLVRRRDSAPHRQRWSTGALAHCDGKRWRPIAEEEVLEGVLVDFDTWRGVTAVLDRDQGAFRTGKGTPRRLPWPLDHEAFAGEDGRRPPILRAAHHRRRRARRQRWRRPRRHAERPHFPHRPRRDRARAPAPCRPGRHGRFPARRPFWQRHLPGVVVTLGPHAWIWKGGAFHVLDVREW